MSDHDPRCRCLRCMSKPVTPAPPIPPSEKVRALVVQKLHEAHTAGVHSQLGLPATQWRADENADAFLNSSAWLAAMAAERDEAYQRGRLDGARWASVPENDAPYPPEIF